MVAAYHFRLWSNIDVPPRVAGFLAYWGLYGVSIFFMLSGFSLAYSYDSSFRSEINPERTTRYLRRRIGRIAPLFLLVLALSVAGKLATSDDPVSALQIFTNATLLFGFYDPSDTPVVGGWSIGTEMAFYLCLPFLILFKRCAIGILIGVIVLSAGIGTMLSSHASLADGWKVYVSPSNHLIFFAIGAFLSPTVGKVRPLSATGLLAGLAIALTLLFWVCSGTSEIALVTGWFKVLMVSLSVAIVLMFSLWNPPGALVSACVTLGGLSYSMYLVHPLFFFGAAIFIHLNAVATLSIFIACIILAAILDIWLDRPIQTLMKARGW
jgi:exopolysaccharide production protein ExoZ